MTVLIGKGVCGGIAFGKLSILKKKKTLVHRTKIENTQEEIKRFENALKTASLQLKALQE